MLRAAAGNSGTAPTAPPEFVGSQTFQLRNVTTATSFPISLSGGVGGLQENDIILVTSNLGSNQNWTQSFSGIYPVENQNAVDYTQIFMGFAADTIYTNLFCGYRIQGPTVDTAIRFPGGTGTTKNGLTAVIHVWRNIDVTNPIDVPATSRALSNTGRAFPLPVTPITGGAVMIICGGSGNYISGSDFIDTNSLDNWNSVERYDTYRSISGMGSKIWTGGTYTPNQFNITSDNARNSCIGVSYALRPAT